MILSVMAKLILIKHASPQVLPAVAPEKWKLSERGRQSCAPLAQKLSAHGPRVIISSTEPKALETTELVAAPLRVAHRPAPDLHEHDRSNVPHMRSGEFISMMELFFRRPDELVLGRETARQAQERFSRAVENVLQQHPQQDVAIVSHGTVISLFLARHAAQQPFQLWREMGLPSFVVLDLPGYGLLEKVARISS